MRAALASRLKEPLVGQKLKEVGSYVNPIDRIVIFRQEHSTLKSNRRRDMIVCDGYEQPSDFSSFEIKFGKQKFFSVRINIFFLHWLTEYTLA